MMKRVSALAQKMTKNQVEVTRMVWGQAKAIMVFVLLGFMRVMWTEYGVFSSEFTTYTTVAELMFVPFLIFDSFVMMGPKKVVQKLPSYGIQDRSFIRLFNDWVVSLVPVHFKMVTIILVAAFELSLPFGVILAPWTFTMVARAFILVYALVVPFCLRYTFFMIRDYRQATRRLRELL